MKKLNRIQIKRLNRSIGLRTIICLKLSLWHIILLLITWVTIVTFGLNQALFNKLGSFIVATFFFQMLFFSGALEDICYDYAEWLGGKNGKHN